MTASAESVDQDYQKSLDFLLGHLNYEQSGSSRFPFRLERMRTLLRRLNLEHWLYAEHRRGVGTPRFPLVHIAGTKGKGSTASMVAACLTAAGLKTGLYSSPHLQRLEERFRVDGECCSREQLISLVARIRLIAEQLMLLPCGSPTFFELTTALAMMHFESSNCQAVVLEVGLGGRLDSTNVCHPVVTAITSIGLDHQHVLGNSVAEIAAEKAGIIKPGVPVISGVTDPEPAKVIQATATQQQAPLFQVGTDFDFQWQPKPQWGSLVDYQGHTPPLRSRKEFALELDGRHQASNAAVASAILECLSANNWLADIDSAWDGFKNVGCIGRIERIALSEDRVAIVDAAHNQDSVAALCESLRSRMAGRRKVIVFGTSRDKSAECMLAQLAEVADELVLTRYLGNPRFQNPQALRPLVPASFAGPVTVCDQPFEAGQLALDRTGAGGSIVVCGSFFIAAELRPWLQAQAANDSVKSST